MSSERKKVIRAKDRKQAIHRAEKFQTIFEKKQKNNPNKRNYRIALKYLEEVTPVHEFK